MDQELHTAPQEVACEAMSKASCPSMGGNPEAVQAAMAIMASGQAQQVSQGRGR